MGNITTWRATKIVKVEDAFYCHIIVKHRLPRYFELECLQFCVMVGDSLELNDFNNWIFIWNVKCICKPFWTPIVLPIDYYGDGYNDCIWIWNQTWKQLISSLQIVLMVALLFLCVSPPLTP
jgi:hypothetical protein